MIKRALVSVADKTGIKELAAGLDELGIEVVSTGGTADVISESGIKVMTVSDITGFQDCLDGRVKTLHPGIHGGILADRSNPSHMRQLKELGIETIDMVVVNLYPFKKTILKGHIELEEALENIDIGGPAMLRAAAKNYRDVVVVTDPADYPLILDEMAKSQDISVKTRFKLAYKVFEHTSHYDTLIAKYLRDKLSEEFFPETLSITFEKVQDMRYGENPHQKAVFYREPGANIGCLTNCKQLHGIELSYNNIHDANGALELLKEYDEPTVVAVKHSTPCGVASGGNILEAYGKAYECDPVSIYGGIIAANREIDSETAEEISKIFVEIIIAPAFSEGALEILTLKKNIRLLQLDNISAKLPDGTYDMKKVAGGLLVQNCNNELLDIDELKCVTDVKPTSEMMEDLIFAMKVVKHTRSIGIVLARSKQTVGIGTGQLSRIMSTRIAVENAGKNTEGAVMASDAYFPFADCVEAAAEAGIKAIIQPGGSKNDQASIDACNKHGIAMLFTAIRHFKH